MKRGQVQLAGIMIGAIASVVASVVTAWGTSSKRVADTEKAVSVLEERENNHYSELKELVLEIRSDVKRIAPPTVPKADTFSSKAERIKANAPLIEGVASDGIPENEKTN